MRNRKKWLAYWVGLALTVSALAVRAEELAPNEPPDSANSKVTEQESEPDLTAIADEAYIYAYPLMLMDATARVMTNVASPDNQHAPVNQFARLEALPDPEFTAVVLPNVDTLYTSSFLDLSHEPVVLRVPNTHGRYYVMPMLDAYSNVFASVGKRTSGTEEMEVAIVGPNFKGDLPWGLRKIAAPTNRVWLLGRTQIYGKDDLPKVIELTRQYSLTPLSSYGKAYSPSENDYIDRTIDMAVTPPQMLASMGDRAYFERAQLLLKEYPPKAADKPALAKFAKLGFGPGQLTPTPAGERALIGARKRAMKQIEARMASLGESQNGWRVSTDLGSYGTHYIDRAAVALYAFGANLPKDAVYPLTSRDLEGHVLDGHHRYTIHFAKGQEPPVYAFWSLTMYNSDGYLVENPIERYALGNRDALKRNPDGSFDILVQADPPQGEFEANWLPAPRGPFQLVMRMYWPQQSVISGQWRMPPVQRVMPQ